MKSQELSRFDLPDAPGVYFFKKGGETLYVGKATRLRDRVRSYFSSDLISARGPLIVEMAAAADSVEFSQTDSVLEALILEANLIKRLKPAYNTMQKDDKSWNYVAITKEKFPRIAVIRGKDLQSMMLQGKAEVGGAKIRYEFGPFPHGLSLIEAMKIVRRIFPYRDLKCVPKEDQKGQAGKPCFNRQIGLCPGVCTGEISAADYAKQVAHIRLFFEGKKQALIRSLEKEMKSLAKAREFEKAAEAKRKIFALGHIRDVSLIKRERTEAHAPAGIRIEAYDIAHTSGSSTVGVMTVVEDGEAKKVDYRMFRIRGDFKGSDTDALKEVLRRRFGHPEWQFPHLIAIDGGTAQLNAAKSVLSESPFDAIRNIPVVSVVKDDRHKADHFLGDEALAAKHQAEIILANSESHRFAVKYHRNLRGRI